MSGRFQLKRNSSICMRIEEERGGEQNATQDIQRETDELPLNKGGAFDRPSGSDDSAVGVVETQKEGVSADSFGQEDDTDVVSTSESDAAESEGEDANPTSKDKKEKQMHRMSSRILSMERRGKINLQRYKSIKFCYFANDYLAVRGDGNDFYLCRVLEDVPESKELFSIAWLDRVDTDKQHYMISFDDVCHQDSVIDRVKLDQVEDDLFCLPTKYLRRVRKLLKTALRMEGMDEQQSQESTGDDADESASENEEDEVEPMRKRRKLGEKKNTIKKKERSGKKEAKAVKKIKWRGLAPNEDITVSHKDPLFDEKNDLPIAHVKRGIRAVLLNDMEMLKDAIFDVANVFTVFWYKSIDNKHGPVHYALLQENKEALNMLFSKKNPEKRSAKYPTASLSKMSTGRYNFYTFGHAVRPIQASRGAKEGNNAFLKEEGSPNPNSDIPLQFCFKRNLSPEIILHYWALNKDTETIASNLDAAIRNGHRELAAYFVKKEDEKKNLHSLGLNFLHKEVLVSENEPLSKFRANSVTKKAFQWNILPLHCAAINPNPKYLRELFSVVPDYQVKDARGRKLIHYAAACKGPGPLKFLLSKGADPNDVDNKGTTPLMIAAKLGRDENIEELMSVTVEEADNDMDLEDADDVIEGSKERKPGQVKRVMIDGKHKKTTKAPIHYAAKNGHESTVALLIKHGAKVDLQAGAAKGNATALVLAAEQGHLQIVKKLVELGASPDMRVRHRKTPLMIAAQNGAYPVMTYLLRIGVNPNAQDSSMNTPIHYAAAYGWYHCLKLLLEAGADPNTGNIWKTTPLSIALLKDNLSCAELLLSTEVDINFPDDKGSTVLMNLMLSDYDDKNLDKIRFLVEKKGADVNITDMNGSSALHCLASNSVYQRRASGNNTNRNRVYFCKANSDVCNKMASLLIMAGADVNAAKEDGHTPITVALLQNNFPLVEQLLRNGADVNIQDGHKELSPPLQMLLSKSEDLDLIEYFQQHANEDAKYDDLTRQALIDIYEKQNKKVQEKIFELLIESGANVNAIDSNGETALMLSIQKSYMERTERLLSLGANPLLGKDQFNHNALHRMALVCTKADYSNILSLINDKFDVSDHVDQTDHDGFTPLLLACETVARDGQNKDRIKLCENYMKILVEDCRANVNAHVTEKTIFKAEDGSQEHRDIPTFDLKIEKKMEIKEDPYGITGKFTCFHFLAMVHQHPDRSNGLIELLAKYAKDDSINARCRHGRTALHQAINSANYFAATKLIDSGCDVNLPSLNEDDDHLLSPLSLASRCPFQFDTVKALLKANASPNNRNVKEGRAALSFAVENRPDALSNGHTVLELVDALVTSGADVKMVDNNGRTALHYLINTSSGGYDVLTQVEEHLLRHGADPFAVDCDGRMPLFYSFSKLQKYDTSLLDPISIVRLLCHHAERAGRLNAMLAHKDSMERTLLHHAALRGALISSSFMLKRGALVTCLDKDGNSPVTLALRSRHHGCALIMLQHNSKLPSWNVVTPVTKEQLEEYEKKKESNKWRSTQNFHLEKPQTIKKSAFQLSIEMDWPGVAYLILEEGAVPLIDAFKAALKSNKLSLALTLLRQRSGTNAYNDVDDKKCNMMHLLAAHADKDRSIDGLITRIARFLLEKKVDPSLADVDGILPIHLAASHAHLGLCKVLLDAYPEGIDIANKDGMTPAAALVFSADEEFKQCHFDLIEYFVKKGVSSLDVCFNTGSFLGNGTPVSTTILNEIALRGNQKMIEYVLDNGADINFANQERETPLMVVIEANLPHIVKLLLGYKRIKLDVKNKQGDSLMHLCIDSRETFYREKKEIFELLKAKRVSLEEIDGKGHSPLYYAMKRSSDTIFQWFPYRLKKDCVRELEDCDELFPFKIEINWTEGEIHVARDAKELKGMNDNDMTEADCKPPVDSALRMNETGIVYADEETGAYYDVLLSKIDVRWGIYGLNVFYKLQVVHHKGKKLWILFNRWGRIGDTGQHQQTPFSTADEACKEFRKIFKSKTGNTWEDLASFKKMPNKYAIVQIEKNPERMLHRKSEILKPFCLEKCPKSSLPMELQNLMQNMTSLHIFTSSFKSSRKFDPAYMPFGLISRENIEEAQQVLSHIKELLTAGGEPTAKDEKVYEQIAELSNNVFTLVPPAQYSFERIRPLNTANDVENYLKNLEELTQLSVASQLLLAAQHNLKCINPLDYCFRALNIHVEAMDHESTESQYILQYIENSFDGDDSPAIASVFRVLRPSESSNFDNCGIKHNRQLLWHGTKSAHMISILKHGFCLDARDSERTGSSLGDGIYFSDSFCKSLNYSNHSDHNSCGFVFLCEVAMGNCSFRGSSSEEQNHDTDSTVLRPSKIPDPKMDYFMPYGAKLPTGILIKNPDMDDDNFWWTQHHECVVPDPNQIKIRYLVMTK